MQFRRYTYIALGAWALAAALLFFWLFFTQTREMELLARGEARASWRKDILYRAWAAGHDGLYMPSTEPTPPDPSLPNIPDREVVTSSGKRLTPINPAYMNREVFRMGRERFGIMSHITSLRPVNPDNAPDPWERAALAAFERGEAEVSSVEPVDGTPHMRLMRPLLTEQGCLTCHESQGYKVGDVRGGISVSIPMEPFIALRRANLWSDFLAIGFLWLIGSAILLAGGRRTGRDLDRLVESEGALRKEWDRGRSYLDELKEQLAFREGVIECAAEGVCVCHGIPEFPFVRFTVWNSRMSEMTGYSMEAINRLGWYQSLYPDPDLQARAIARMDRMREGDNLKGEEWEITRSDGEKRVAAISTSVLQRGDGTVHVLALMQDVTERKRTEEETGKLQAQLQQAMKMEAVGRLAGGVAHDFNNLLTVIIGNVSMALGMVPPSEPVAGMLSEVNKAAERAVRLTQQLLAFSRRQILEPKVLDLNAMIVDLHSMLVRLIGEHIELTTVPCEGLWAVKVDPGQLEQILVNLAVNARDAMRDGGKLSIETSNVELDEAYCAAHPDATPGRFVLLSVSDTGHGITDEVRGKIFDPFFTTKPKGSGTGLGLSMTYGAVRQAGGSIDVLSEVDKGTSVRIHFPRVEMQVEKAGDPDPQEPLDGTETVLFVEDEEALRKLGVRVLERLGYKVLQAGSGAEAIALAQGHGGPIDLLLTDVVMPGMNGSELATQLVILHPETKVLFTSGYTDDVIVHHGVLDVGVFFIGKPYTPSSLAKKIREVLGNAG